MKRLFLTVALLTVSMCLMAEPKPEAEKQAQAGLFFDLGVLKYGKADASGSREILVLTKDGTGVFTHQHLIEADGKDFLAILTKRGVVQEIPNAETGQREKHLMVFNPKDKHTYVWVPFSKLQQMRDQIKHTGKTVQEPAQPKRVTETGLAEMNFDLTK